MPQLLPLNIQRTEQLVAPKQQIKIQSRQDRQINEEGHIHVGEQVPKIRLSFEGYAEIRDHGKMKYTYTRLKEIKKNKYAKLLVRKQ